VKHEGQHGECMSELHSYYTHSYYIECTFLALLIQNKFLLKRFCDFRCSHKKSCVWVCLLRVTECLIYEPDASQQGPR